MSFWTLILRSLRFHARAHLGVLLGATVASAALAGALVVGDSVRESLRELALMRLGRVETALASNDRFFRADLAGEIQLEGDNRGVPVLELPGTATAGNGAARANHVQVLGVNAAFWKLANQPPAFGEVADDAVILSEALARQLQAAPGDSILVRVPKPSQLSRDAPLTPQEDASVALRLKVQAIVPDEQLGRFSLRANQIAPLNAFVGLGLLQERIGQAGRANLLLVAGAPKNAADAAAAGNTSFRKLWQLADAELKLREVAGGGFELRTGRVFVDPPVVEAARKAEARVQPILTYFVNEIRDGDRATPYSMVTAMGEPVVPPDMREDEILVNDWLAKDLQARPGDKLRLTYFVIGAGRALEERQDEFRVRGVVPLAGAAADRNLMPDFPGLAKAETSRDWDAGFPLQLSRIRPQDEKYWQEHRGTPKAFVTVNAGRRMWANRFGEVTALRFPPRDGVTAATLTRTLLQTLDPAALGLAFQPVREQAMAAGEQAMDFGGLFIGFSFFLIVAALLLMALLFQFGLEQRATEVGTLLALGFQPRQVRRLLLGEGAALASAGGILGALGGVLYARVMLHGLTTVWRDAVGTSALRFHATTGTLVIGMATSTVIAALTIWLALRRQARQPARELLAEGSGGEFGSYGWERGDLGFVAERRLTGWQMRIFKRRSATQLFTTVNRGLKPTATVRSRSATPVELEAGRQQGEAGRVSSEPRQRRRLGLWIGVIATISALGMTGWAVASRDTSSAETFFSAGSLLLIAGLGFAAAWLRGLARSGKAAGATAALSVGRLGLRGSTRRHTRSLATIGLLACGVFLIVAVGAFRLDANLDATRRSSGTGGFALIGEAAMPVAYDLNSQAGRDFYGLNSNQMAGVSVTAFRVREGDDASCLNLNRAQKPRVIGVNPAALQERRAFTFAEVEKGLPEDQPWLLLKRDRPGAKFGPDEVPAVADLNSILWALGKKVGDTLDYTDERGRAFKLRLVGAVANSVLQGNLIIDEAEFVKRFPGESGYRMFLVDAPSNTVAAVSATLTRALQDAGLELTPAAARLNAFNAVQNTYLSTFQALGGLGLLLGSAGLGVVVLRNVQERRGELALLLAVGFRRRALHWLVLSEHGALLGLGLAVGMGAAVIGVLPALLSPGSQIPYVSLAVTLAGVLLNGLVWAWLATRFALRGRLLDALRNE